MFEEVANFLEQVRSDINNLGLVKNFSNIKDMLKEERFGFEVSSTPIATATELFFF